ncbi:nicotinamide riboside transporter PnuC [Alteromonas sp. LMIT006]|jgi:nicotinamide mononucleotide transporter|uniref:nicotinamide riboside transporter PnuC n=1 Tax=Alteromonadaceae TaxID=72275 RepID=UPI0020CA754E|nr:nicotinamide riboside transporter PnuC [Alteromonas sp. LMIT006]UTP71738.1 nicotinamide riboside transporter PnuC [Alteromonas sp. LMIT006]
MVELLSISWLEAVAALLGILYIYAVSQEWPIAWPAAFVSTALYTYVFGDSTLWYSAGLNVYYMGMAVYGYWQWTYGNKAQIGDISSRSSQWHVTYVVTGLAIVCTLVFWSEQAWLDWATLDALIMVFSVMTTVLVAHKYLSNWVYWMIINTLAMLLYWQYALWFTVGLYFVYLVFSVFGWRQWRKRA